MIAGLNGRSLEHAHWSIAQVLAPSLGMRVARDRAAQLACCLDLELEAADVRETLETCRHECNGGVDVSDEEIERLTEAVLLAMQGLS